MEERERHIEALKGMQVAVTGATGMLGSELIRQLLPYGPHIRLVVRNAGRLAALYGYLGATPPFRIVETSLTNPVELAEALKGVDIVFNCAARVSFRFDEVEEIIRVNTGIAHHVVNACLEVGTGKLVHVSSIAALGEPDETGLITEKSFPEHLVGKTGYAMSKYYSENEVWRGMKRGLKAVIVNPAVILGPGDWNGYGSAALFAAFARGIPFYTSGVTGYVDVRDVARAMILLSVAPEADGNRYILSAGNFSYRELMSRVAASVGKPAPRIEAGEQTMYMLGFVSWAWAKLRGKRSNITPGIIRSALEKNYYNGEAVREAIEFNYLPMEETIRYMAAHYLEHKERKKQWATIRV